MPVKGQGTVVRKLVQYLARRHRNAFIQQVYGDAGFIYRQLDTQKRNSLSLVSFSSSRDLPEQLLSIYSFVRQCGLPERWVVYSDDSHTSADGEVLSRFPFLRLVRLPWHMLARSELKTGLQPYYEALCDYAHKCPLGKKLFCFLNHAVEEPTLFLDSDIVFYAKAGCINALAATGSKGYFLRDVGWGNVDGLYKERQAPEAWQANSGFFILPAELQHLQGLQHLQQLKGRYHYFSEQTILHILFKENQLQPLDRELFFINTSDQFRLGYNFKREAIALRHYTGPVRYKMWQKNWQWHLE